MKTVKTLSITVLTAAALLTSALATPASAVTPANTTGDSAGIVPPTSHCSLVDFDSAVVKQDGSKNQLTLVVSGIKPSSNVTVELNPVVYIRQPEYWIIEVDGCTSGIGLPVLTPYVATLDITSTVGTMGIEVHGANQKLQIPIKPAIIA